MKNNSDDPSTKNGRQLVDNLNFPPVVIVVQFIILVAGNISYDEVLVSAFRSPFFAKPFVLSLLLFLSSVTLIGVRRSLAVQMLTGWAFLSLLIFAGFFTASQPMRITGAILELQGVDTSDFQVILNDVSLVEHKGKIDDQGFFEFPSVPTGEIVLYIARQADGSEPIFTRKCLVLQISHVDVLSGLFTINIGQISCEPRSEVKA